MHPSILHRIKQVGLGDEPEYLLAPQMTELKFQIYARKFYHYRWEFYRRSKNPRKRLLNFFDMMAHGEILADKTYNDGRSTDIKVFPIRIDFNLPKKQIEKQIDELKKNILSDFELNKKCDPFILRDYIKKYNTQRTNYFRKQKSTADFSLWTEYITAYDLSLQTDMLSVGISMGYHGGTEEHDESARIQATNAVIKAKQLIQNSGLETFPYLPSV